MIVEFTTMADAIRIATARAVQGGAVVMGLGVRTDPKRIFGTIPDLPSMHYEDGPVYDYRYIETPTSEAAMTGVAVGRCMAGQKVIMVHQRVEFALLAVEQIINNAAKLSFISNGRYRCPLLIRMIIGRGWGQGPTHSQSLENIWAGVPGLVLCCPSTPQDAYDMVLQAMEREGPTVMLEHRWLHGVKGNVSHETIVKKDDFKVRRLSHGHHMTMVGWGSSIPEMELARREMQKIGIMAIDSFDVPYLTPCDDTEIVESVTKTERLLIVDQGYGMVGRAMASRLIGPRAGRVRIWHNVLDMHRTPVPASKELNRWLYPDAREIYEAALNMFAGWKYIRSQALIDRQMRANNDQPDYSLLEGPF